jgi:hypothetical protein
MGWICDLLEGSKNRRTGDAEEGSKKKAAARNSRDAAMRHMTGCVKPLAM